MLDPNFHKNLQHQRNICDPYICPFDYDCHSDDEQNNTFEILHVFLLSNVFYHLQRALTLQQRTLNDLGGANSSPISCSKVATTISSLALSFKALVAA